ncbi:hypothetical protein ACYP3S_10375 [Klebsiella pneumoniae]
MHDLLTLLPANGRAVLTIVDGAVTAVNVLTGAHHIATLESLIELLQAAGYTVTRG